MAAPTIAPPSVFSRLMMVFPKVNTAELSFS